MLWGERPGPLQLLGAALVLAALVLIHAGGGEQREAGGVSRSLPLLLLTLLAGGGADAMAKVFEQLGRPGEDRLYFFYLFLTAAVLTGALALLERRRTGKRILLPELAAGIAVGVPNYFSSYLLLAALQRLPAFLAYPVFSTGTILLVLLLSAPAVPGAAEQTAGAGYGADPGGAGAAESVGITGTTGACRPREKKNVPNSPLAFPRPCCISLYDPFFAVLLKLFGRLNRYTVRKTLPVAHVPRKPMRIGKKNCTSCLFSL